MKSVCQCVVFPYDLTIMTKELLHNNTKFMFLSMGKTPN